MSIMIPPRLAQGTKWLIFDAQGHFHGRARSEEEARRATQSLAEATGQTAYAQRHYHETDCAFVIEPCGQ